LSEGLTHICTHTLPTESVRGGGAACHEAADRMALMLAAIDRIAAGPPAGLCREHASDTRTMTVVPPEPRLG
jgi:hypothetical protein